MKSQQIRFPERNKAQREHNLREDILSWYDWCDEPVVFDKGRGWTSLSMVLGQIFPNSKILLMIRDPRDVFAGIERQHALDPILTDAVLGEDTMVSRAKVMFGPKGLIGGPIRHIEDILRRKPQNVIPVVAEEFARNPEESMRIIYAKLREDWHPHDFDNVENVSEDVDGIYNYKFLHRGCGKVQPPDDRWQDVLSDDVASMIVNTWPKFCAAFGYKDATPASTAQPQPVVASA
jgi:hypothetical protein